MRVKRLNELASEMVGDGKKQNTFFVTMKGNVVMIALDFSQAHNYWRSIANTRVESALEDRQTGVIASAGMEPSYTGPIRWIVCDDSLTFGFRS